MRGATGFEFSSSIAMPKPRRALDGSGTFDIVFKLTEERKPLTFKEALREGYTVDWWMLAVAAVLILAQITRWLR